MRGRTNITQRKFPVINGAIKQMVIASGNTITNGDFVSPVYSKTSYDWKFYETLYDKFVVNRNLGKYIFIFGNTAYLVKFENGSITTLDTLDVTGFNKGCYYDKESNKFTVTKITDIATADVAYEYTITNDEFVFVKNLPIGALKQPSSSYYFQVHKIIPHDGGYICVGGSAAYTTSYVRYYSTVIYCNSSFEYVEQKADTNGYYASVGIFAYKDLNGRIFVSLNNSDNQSGVGSEFTCSLYDIAEKTWNTYSQSVRNCTGAKLCNFNESLTVSFLVFSSSGNPFLISVNDYDGVATFVTNGSGVFNKNGDIVQIGSSSYVLKTYDEQNLIVEQVQSENYNFPVYNNLYFEICNLTTGEEAFIFMLESSNKISYVLSNYQNGNVYFGDLTDYVKSYDGSAIGFAGGSGNAGTSIPVYVPLSN